MTDTEAKERLPLIVAVATRLLREYGPRLGGVEFEDLVACGSKGLLDAEKRFDPARGVAFETFAYRRIRGAMLDGVRALGPYSRSQCERHRENPEDLRAAGPFDEDSLVLNPQMEERLDRVRLLTLVAVTLSEFEPRMQRLVRGYFFEEKTLEEIGKELGFCKSWASRLLERVLRELRVRIRRRHPDLIGVHETGRA